MCYSGWSSPSSKKESDAKIFTGVHRALAIVFHRGSGPAATQWHTGRAGGVFARRSALLPSCDRSRRLHHSRLPAAKSPQDDQGLRLGAEKSRTISARFGRSSPQAHYRLVRPINSPTPTPPAIADSIGFGIVFPYMGFAIPWHARHRRGMRSHCFKRM